MANDNLIFTTSPQTRRGICCAGSWIVDHVKTVNTWPTEETLADIIQEDRGTGGSAYNLCIDFSRFGADFPITALGLVGEDADGLRIRGHMQEIGVDIAHLRAEPGALTAYTDVINVQHTGRRTFFHQRGANALLGPDHFPIDALRCRILSLGYLLLLDTLDAEDSMYGTAAARVLATCQQAGIRTAVDLVSEDSDRFTSVVTPVLPYTDYLIINEIEAERTTGRSVRNEGTLEVGALEDAARSLLDLGVAQLVVLHAPEGAVAVQRSGEPIWQQSLALPRDFIRGTAGAGDAFFAGILYGLHEGWTAQRQLEFAHGAAASCLRHPTCTEGVGGTDEIDRLCAEFGWCS